MKNIIIPNKSVAKFLGLPLFFFIMFLGINIGYLNVGCGCLDKDESLRRFLIYQIERDFLEKYKREYGKYPNYNELVDYNYFKDIVFSAYPDFYKYNGDEITKKGIYYSLDSSGENYILKGYIEIEKSDNIFWMKFNKENVLVDVREQ